MNSIGHTLIEEANQSLAELVKEEPVGIRFSDGDTLTPEDFPEPQKTSGDPGYLNDEHPTDYGGLD